MEEMQNHEMYERPIAVEFQRFLLRFFLNINQRVVGAAQESRPGRRILHLLKYVMPLRSLAACMAVSGFRRVATFTGQT